ncbi:anti-sigma factor family protein [Desulfosarcina ovata]|uniref:Putative zinc-finger domain-containing protein n=2 Tax=Desulfosarcina ovata TaxID=83564 RepID=A0A5K8A3T0_9BACT|nr:zf-HC2 domain-containing protein [Desulfosarcina ovata]BBO80344.1 hypothetical protein DSCO28_09100 [Desulfosarcina ovata subsp. sediminis]BBO87121.1 hypothetical protein DSCOOX_03010 [Desulfosarcina ovata subsp. ovata]
MTTPRMPCDEALLNRYLDGQLDPMEQQRMESHLAHCRECRRQVAILSGFSRGLCRRIEQASETVDFSALEKEVVIKALRPSRAVGGNPLLAAMKFLVPMAATAGVLLFFAHSHFLAKPDVGPSAIINSFTGSMSSVMIFETPNTHQTILWYNETTDAESEQDAV